MPETLSPPPSAPASPAAPAPVSSPSPSTQTSQGGTPPKDGFDAFDDQFKDLDETPAPAKPEPKEPETKLPEPKPQPDKGKPADKPKTEPKPDTEPADDYEPPKSGIEQVRGWALRMGKKAKQANAELEQVRARIAELEKAPRTNGHAPDPDLTNRLTEYEKKVADYEQQLRLTRYERSQEYKDKYEKPAGIAEARAKREIESLIVETKQKDPDTGEEKVVSSRPGTWRDFHQIYNLARPDARRVAKAMFGEDADIVLRHYDDIHQKWEDAHLAVEEYKKQGSDAESREEAKKKQDAAFRAEGWNKANEMFATKHPEWFAEREGDSEGNELLNKGLAFVDTFMDPDDRERYPVPQQIIADARIRNWAGSFLRNQRDLTKLKAERDEALKTIEQLRGSAPGAAGGGGDAKPEDDKSDWRVAIDKAL